MFGEGGNINCPNNVFVYRSEQHDCNKNVKIKNKRCFDEISYKSHGIIKNDHFDHQFLYETYIE